MKTKTLDSIAPLMSITGYSTSPITPLDINSDLKVRVEYSGYGKKPKVFSGTVTRNEWDNFMKKVDECTELFWEM